MQRLHNNINTDIEWNERRLKDQKELAGISHWLVEQCFKEEHLENAWNRSWWCSTYRYDKSSPVYSVYLQVRLPHRKSNIKAMNDHIIAQGFNLVKRDDKPNKVELHMDYKKRYEDQEFLKKFNLFGKVDVQISLVFDDIASGATCTMMPLKYETKVVPTVFEKICKEEHPEMFNEEGILIPERHPLYVSPPEKGEEVESN